MVWDFLCKADTIHVASGQKILVYEPGSSSKEELIKKATGRTGNLRAPALRVGRKLYIGFNVSMYENLVKQA